MKVEVQPVVLSDRAKKLRAESALWGGRRGCEQLALLLRQAADEADLVAEQLRNSSCACSVSGLHFGAEDPRHADHQRLYHQVASR